MAFKKGDKNINRKGRPKNAEPDLLRKALAKEGKKRNQDFWDKVAEFAYTDKNVMVAIIKKFVPDMSSSEIKVDALVSYTKMGEIIIDDKPKEFDIGATPDS